MRLSFPPPVLLFTLLCTTLAQLSLPLIPSPGYASISGDVLVGQQLLSWGIHLGPISIDLGLGISPRALNGAESVDTTSFSSPSGSRRRSRERGLLGNLGLELTLGIGKESPKSPAATPAQGSGSGLGVDLGVNVLGLDLQAKLDAGLLKWGEADTVAKGARGDTEWFTYLSLGTPPQSIPLLPDTGSSDFFIFSSSCKTCYLQNHTAFDPSSSTFTNYSTRWGIQYGDGDTVRGVAGSDLVHMGNMASVRVPFALADRVTGSSWRQSPRSGILGLALDDLSTLTVPSVVGNEGMTLFSRLVKGEVMSANVLSIRLEKGRQRQGVVQEEGGGAFTFGGVEDWYILGGRAGLAWVRVTSSIYWGFDLDDISYGSTSILAGEVDTPRRAIVDTGTTLIITSDQASLALHARIAGSWQDPQTGIWYIPCTTSYPSTSNVFFTIGRRRYGVQVEDLAWKVSTSFSGQCISGIQGGMPHFTILGTMFIKNHYVVLSYGSGEGDGLRVGLGRRSDIPPVL